MGDMFWGVVCNAKYCFWPERVFYKFFPWIVKKRNKNEKRMLLILFFSTLVIFDRSIIWWHLFITCYYTADGMRCEEFIWVSSVQRLKDPLSSWKKQNSRVYKNFEILPNKLALFGGRFAIKKKNLIWLRKNMNRYISKCNTSNWFLKKTTIIARWIRLLLTFFFF